jgi:hypothetical protein
MFSDAVQLGAPTLSYPELPASIRCRGYSRSTRASWRR